MSRESVLMDPVDQNRIFCRELYKAMRKQTGCPPIVARQLSPSRWGWYVETNDGEVSLDQVEASNVWDAKCKCIEEWERLKGVDPKLKQLRKRWFRWLGQVTREDRDTWVELLDSNWKGWAIKVLEAHGIREWLPTVAGIEHVKGYYERAIGCANLEELRVLDDLFCNERINRPKRKKRKRCENE